MNPTRFDTVTKLLAASTSRRRTLKGLVVTTAGGLLGLGTLWKLSRVMASSDPLEEGCRDQDLHTLGKQQKLVDHYLKKIEQDPGPPDSCGPGSVQHANGSNRSFSSTSGNHMSGQINCPPGQTGCNGICCPSGQCVNGLCCPAGQTGCNGVCCPAGQCVNGVCCPAGQTICNGVCCASGQGCSRFTQACCNPSGSVCALPDPGACCSGICINGSPPRCA
jgi:hypothetical protein